MPASHCALKRSGTITVQLFSSASEEEYPKVLVAAAFHSTILPLRASTTTTASLTLSRSSSIPKSCSSMAYITPHTQRKSRRDRMGRAKALAVRFLSEYLVFLHVKNIRPLSLQSRVAGCATGSLRPLEAVMNSIRNGLGMRETEIVKEPTRPRNPHFY